jgi:hypothetical protein
MYCLSCKEHVRYVFNNNLFQEVYQFSDEQRMPFNPDMSQLYVYFSGHTGHFVA